MPIVDCFLSESDNKTSWGCFCKFDTFVAAVCSFYINRGDIVEPDFWTHFDLKWVPFLIIIFFIHKPFGLLLEVQMTFLKNINWTVVTWGALHKEVIGLSFLLLHFWCINNIKARNEKSEWKKRWFFDENLRLLDRFWGGFPAVDFKAG